MYAIVQNGGKQYKAEVGAKIIVEKLELDVNAELKLDVVLIVKNGTTNTKGTVKAKVVEHGLGPKLDIFKYKPKKNYRRRQGHRQPYTLIEITEVA